MSATQIAINVSDLSHPKVRQAATWILSPLRIRRVVNAEKGKLDGGAVVLDCSPGRAAAIVLTLRRKLPRLRAYVGGPRGGWRRARKGELERAVHDEMARQEVCDEK